MAELVKTDALSHFTRLGNKSYFLDPKLPRQQAPNDDDDAPTLILLCAWMNADARHIAKYTEAYEAQYPRSPILLLTASSADFFVYPLSSRSAAAQARAAESALVVDLVKGYADTPDARILAHAFSNGGGGSLALLAAAYRQATGAPLPVNAIVYDSLPGRARLWAGLAAFSLGFPRAALLRWPLQAVTLVGLFLWYTLPGWLGRRNRAEVMRAALNATGKEARETQVLRREAPRCYVYSEADKLIRARDVEDHADEGESRGLRVTRVKFVGCGAYACGPRAVLGAG